MNFNHIGRNILRFALNATSLAIISRERPGILYSECAIVYRTSYTFIVFKKSNFRAIFAIVLISVC